MDTGADLRRLTSLRAFAALAVFLHHCGNENNWLIWDRYVRYGSAGVAFFFVLSGFVLTWAWRPGDETRLFYVRRFARIWPAHVVALATGVVAFAPTDPRITWESVVANLLLLQAWAPPPLNTLNGVSWSLSVEAFFYAVAPLIIVASHRVERHRFMWGAGALIGLTLAVRLVWSLVERNPEGGINYYLYEQPALRLSEFVAGVVIAVLVRDGWRPRFPVPAAIAAAGVVVLAISVPDGSLPGAIPEVILLPAFALLIAAAAGADLRGTPGLLQHRALVYAGELSFAFYLLHGQVLFTVEQYVTLFPSKPVGALYTLGTFLLAGLAAAALHHLVEKPAQRRIVRAARTRLPVPSLR
ncbi:acyltransferase family protein [Nocardioides glacieisoli]|uniref:acyltransferase family protein n=1 Tax=Nocardioides glacieisoli TaxID=1168730 RepID=UPI0013ED501B|nr:acyltransferase [Nocardioides glacieisoli]